MDENRREQYKLTDDSNVEPSMENKHKHKTHHWITIVSLVCFLMLGFLLGFIFGIDNGAGGLSLGNNDNQGFSSAKTGMISEYFKDFWLYGEDYENLEGVLSEQAYHGMTNFPFDPYTTYQSNEEMNDFASSINMNFVGIGISYTIDNELPIVTRVFKDAPAEHAGVMPGDIIETIDGKSLIGLETADIKAMVVGKEDTLVRLGVNRQGEKMELDIFRGPVDSTVYGYTMNDIPVLNIMSFGEKTHDECIKYLDAYTDSDRLIIDLRDNGGGYQTAVEDIAGLFLPKGSIVMKVVDRDGNETISNVKGKKYYDNFKDIAILINENTASAAEVLTMALVEQHPHAFTVGETSYGKGVVQTTIPMYDGSALKLTTTKWLSSKGVWINDVGIVPNYEVLKHPALYERYWPMEDNESFALDSVGEFVRLSSLALDYLDYDVERTDGYFDQSLENALMKFEQEHNLEVNGILEKDDYQTIVSSLLKTFALDTDKDVQLQEALKLIAE